MVYVINTLGKPCLLEEKRRKSAWCGLADLGALILIVVQCSVKFFLINSYIIKKTELVDFPAEVDLTGGH
jgi:uncharacterized membrane protein